MYRAALRGTALELAAIAVLCIAVFFAARSIARTVAPHIGASNDAVLTGVFFVLFGGSLVFVAWSFSRRRASWSDDLEKVVSLNDFLGLPHALLAPNLDGGDRANVLRSLESISARSDVLDVSVGLVTDEGNVSDRVLVMTYASSKAIREWASLLKAEHQRVSSLKYEVGGRRQRVRGILFVWD